MMNFQNPYLNPYGIQPQYTPPTQVVKVNGENGARTYNLGANSSALLLDESGLMVWLITTDGAGYKTVSAYDITPHQAKPEPDFGSLESRIKRLEDMINDTTDSSAARRRYSTPDPADDQHGQVSRKPAADAEPAYAKQPADEAGYGNRESVWRGRE